MITLPIWFAIVILLIASVIGVFIGFALGSEG